MTHSRDTRPPITPRLCSAIAFPGHTIVTQVVAATPAGKDTPVGCNWQRRPATEGSLARSSTAKPPLMLGLPGTGGQFCKPQGSTHWWASAVPMRCDGERGRGSRVGGLQRTQLAVPRATTSPLQTRLVSAHNSQRFISLVCVRWMATCPAWACRGRRSTRVAVGIPSYFVRPGGHASTVGARRAVRPVRQHERCGVEWCGQQRRRAGLATC